MAIGVLKAGVNSQDVTASTGTDVVDTVNYVYGYAIGEVIAGLSSESKLESIIRSSLDVANINDRIGIVGDSRGADRLPWVISILLGGRGYMPIGYNHAVGGWEATDMLPDVADVNADQFDVLFFTEGYNSLTTGAGETGASLYEQQRTLVDYYLNSGYTKTVFMCLNPPTFADVSGYQLTEAQDTQRKILNNLWLANTDPRVVVEDELEWVTSDMFSDGLHDNMAGAWIRLSNSAYKIRALFERSPVIRDIFTSDNIIHTTSKNPALALLTGGNLNPVNGASVTGDVPRDWQVAGDGAITVVSEILENHFGLGVNGVKLTISGTPLNSTSNVKFKPQYSLVSGGLIGEGFEAFIDFELLEGATGISNIQTVATTLGSPLDHRLEEFTTEKGVAPAMSGTLRSRQTSVLAVDTANIPLEWRIRFRQGVAINVEIIFGRPVFRKTAAI